MQRALHEKVYKEESVSSLWVASDYTAVFRLCCRFCKSAPLKKQEKLDLSMHKIIAILQNSAAFAPRQAIYELEGAIKEVRGFQSNFVFLKVMKCLSKAISPKHLCFYILIKIPN